jgi:hypothetical protein
MANKCELIMDRYVPLDIANESEFIICSYVPLIGRIGGIYPDTTLSFDNKNIGYTTNPNEIAHRSVGSISREQWISSFPKDTVSIYIFNKDTLDVYSWQVIQQNYKILQRYDLSLEDINNLKDKYGIPVIAYPPNEKMKNMKMYPPYEE